MGIVLKVNWLGKKSCHLNQDPKIISTAVTNVNYHIMQTTGESSPMSFLTGVVMTYVWYRYGQLIGNNVFFFIIGLTGIFFF
jgi:hypothetical protein